MPELRFDGTVIPVTHLLPDDVIVLSVQETLSMDALTELFHKLRKQFPEPRKILLTDHGMDLTIDRDGTLIPVGES